MGLFWVTPVFAFFSVRALFFYFGFSAFCGCGLVKIPAIFVCLGGVVEVCRVVVGKTCGVEFGVEVEVQVEVGVVVVVGVEVEVAKKVGVV